MLCCLEHVLVDLRRCRCHHVPGTIEIRRNECSLRDRHTRLMKLRPNLRRDDGDECTVREQARQLRRGDWTTANEKHAPTRQLQKDRVHVFYAVTPCGATTRSKSDNARPILT